jgi:GT2 family glycosyltransferase
VCEEDSGQYDALQEVFWATGAALLIRSRVFHELGGFDAYFFAHMEEIDLCWRIQLAGYKVMACPQSVVYHVGGGTLPKGNSRKTFLNFRNNLVMLWKNLSWKERWWKVPLRFSLDQVAALKALAGGDGGYFVAVIKSQLHFLHWLFIGKTPRRPFPLRPLKSLSGVYPGQLIIDYFLRGKKRFSELMHPDWKKGS